jgi:hypothetical protein
VRYGFVSRLLPGQVDNPFAFALMTILCLRLRLDHGEMEQTARVSPQGHHAILVVQRLMCVWSDLQLELSHDGWGMACTCL